MKQVVAGYVGFFATRFRQNWPGFLKARWPYLVVVCLAAAADFLSTWRFMAAGGIEDEFHPVIRLVSQWCGPFIGPLIGKLGQFAAVLMISVLFPRWAVFLYLTVTAVYLYAAWYNVWGASLYTPVFLRYLSQNWPSCDRMTC